MRPINLIMFACIAVLGYFGLDIITPGGIENVPHYVGAVFG